MNQLKEIYQVREGADPELRERLDNYWNFDSKGRNIEDMQKRIMYQPSRTLQG
jgi:hypothetical protein